MAAATIWQLLFVDDDPDICRQVQEFLDGEIIPPDDRLRVETLNNFGDALNALEVRRFDLLLLDVRLGPYSDAPDEEAGITTLQAIRQRRFIPVVFYTGLPHLVHHLEKPLIQVVEKTAGLPRLLDSLKSILATRVPAVNRALIRHLETIQREYMWDFVANHWGQLSDISDHTSLAYLLARRLALSLSGSGIQQLAQELGDSTGTTVTAGQVHPMRYYVMPPVEPAPLAGDIYQGQVGEHNGNWVLLTPSCDMVTGREKADMVLLARCLPLTEQVEYQQWRDGLPKPSNTHDRKLQDLLRNNRRDSQSERFYFLPGALSLPDLVVDFQQLVTLQREQMGGLERLASLDSPFAEALLARFGRYFDAWGRRTSMSQFFCKDCERCEGEYSVSLKPIEGLAARHFTPLSRTVLQCSPV
jgi:CheY-like chemotaxis protein